MKKIVGIFTTFADWNREYSLISVVHDQLTALVRGGYTPVLFVLDSFNDEAIKKLPKGIEVRKVVKQILLEPYKGLGYPEKWREDIGAIKTMLAGQIEDIDFLICHDIFFIDTYLPYNWALRELIGGEKIKARVFSWIHSAPSPRPVLENNPHASRYTLPPHTKIVYLNHDKIVPVAEMFGTYPTNVHVVHNSIDPRTFWLLHPFVAGLIDKYSLLKADIISVYPVSTPRMVDGKQVLVLIRLHAELKKLGYETRLIVPNAHANAEGEKMVIQKCVELAESEGLHKDNIIFTSLEGKEWEMGIPREAVSDLFRLANVFIFPSISENCSLILLEAMLSGNLLVLNKDCSGLQEFGGKNALYFKMGNLDMGKRNKEDALETLAYYRDMAKIVVARFEANPALQAKRETMKTKNLDILLRNLENLFYEQ